MVWRRGNGSFRGPPRRETLVPSHANREALLPDAASPRTLPFLRDLPADAAAELAAAARERTLAAGETLFAAGGASPGIVVEGRVRVVRELGGRRHVVHDEGPGGTLGELPVYDGGPLPATAIAAEPTRVVVLPADAVRRAIARHPAVAAALLARLAGRVRGLVDRLDRLTARSVQARLTEHLAARLAVARASIVTLGMTQAQLAEELGTVCEVVVRELLALRRRGVLKGVGAGKYEVVDAGALREIASGTVRNQEPGTRGRAKSP